MLIGAPHGNFGSGHVSSNLDLTACGRDRRTFSPLSCTSRALKLVPPEDENPPLPDIYIRLSPNF
jgi:hypothetical protein